jgi:uncharacterized protein YrrD
MVQKCSRCEEEMFPFEIQCSTCHHRQTLLNIQNVKSILNKMFMKNGFTYDEFAATIEKQKI